MLSKQHHFASARANQNSIAGRPNVIETEHERTQYESMPEFVRESYSQAHADLSAPKVSKTRTRRFRDTSQEEAKTTRELEALWPGVNHDFLQPSRRSASFYFTTGFLAGVLAALAGAYGYSVVSSSMSTALTMPAGLGTVVTAGKVDSASSGKVTTRAVSGTTELVVPLYPTYSVQEGDTLAGIALKAYKRMSPRLLDEICAANKMTNANVLQLGQKLVLPEYRMQTSRIAAGAAQSL